MTGITFRTYITYVRVFKAKGLLREGYSVNIVGEMVGFKSISYFISTFTKIEGISPKRYSKLLISSTEFSWRTAKS